MKALFDIFILIYISQKSSPQISALEDYKKNNNKLIHNMISLLIIYLPSFDIKTENSHILCLITIPQTLQLN